MHGLRKAQVFFSLEKSITPTHTILREVQCVFTRTLTVVFICRYMLSTILNARTNWVVM